MYDGSGGPPRSADVLVESGRIAAIAPGIVAEPAERIDASGCVVTPGFIDMHRHCDAVVLADPNFGEIELAQGITSVIGGNCGIAPVPVDLAAGRAYLDYIEPVTGPVQLCPAYESYKAYRTVLEAAKLPLNVGFLIGSGAVKQRVKGMGGGSFTADELERASSLVSEGMDCGAMGVSIGLIYQPECYTSPEEIARYIRPAAQRDGLLTCHIRSEGDQLVRAVEEALGIAKTAGMRVNISHFKATGRRNWRSTLFSAIDAIEKARADGQEVTVDVYPYDAGSTTLLSCIPQCLLEEGHQVAFERMVTPQGKNAVRAALAAETGDWDNMVRNVGWERIIVSSVTLDEHRAYQGRDVQSIAEELGTDPVDLVCDLLAAERGKVGIVTRSMAWKDVMEILRLPYAAVISDSLYCGGRPHPRLYGAFPRVVRLAIDQEIIPLSEAVRKMTAMSAERLRLTDRGRLVPGMIADINMFDPAEFRDEATFDTPARLATGMRETFVGGERRSAARGCVLKPSTRYIS